jgi:hypothetical protein
MIGLTSLTRSHVAVLFRAEEAAGAERLLAHECADTLPVNAEAATPTGLERIRFAAIRVSGGSLDRLREAVRLAQVDWRDLLVAADFAVSADAHERWHPRPFDAAVVRQWRSGALPPGVAFGPAEHVRVLAGRRQGTMGSVQALLGLEPEPRYLVALGPGERIEAEQRMLARAGSP